METVSGTSTTALTETPVPGSVGDDYFYRMLSPNALELAKPYYTEETTALRACLRHCPNAPDLNFVAVGGGELWELRTAARYTKSYTCIEPLADIFLNDSVRYLIEQMPGVSVIGKRFGEVSRGELPKGKAFFMFLFNILAYIEDPIQTINNVARPGDILFMTTWAKTPEARRVRQAYFDHLNSTEDEVIIDPEQSIGLAHLDNFPFHELPSYKKHELSKSAITETLVIYL